MFDTTSILSALRQLGLAAEGPQDANEPSALEAAWLSGYFAALARERSAGASSSIARPVQARSAASPADAPIGPATRQPSEVRANAAHVRILFASETGNAAALAQTIAERIRAVSQSVDVVDLASYKPRALEREQTVIVVTSTHGDGTPPEPALRFFEQLQGPTAPKSLPQLRFAVLGLGDSTYEHFCRTAKIVDERLAGLGASRLTPRLECDLDYHEPAAAWTEQIVELLRAPGDRATEDLRIRDGSDTVDPGTRPKPQSSRPKPGFDKDAPFQAIVLENFQLTGRGSTKETRHLTLSLEESQLRFAPGDALGIFAPNEPALAHQLARALGATGDELVSVDGQPMSVANALLEQVDLAVATPAFLRVWVEASGSSELAALTRDEALTERRLFLRSHHIIDIVRAHPASHVDPEKIVRSMRRLAPRLYSIASSLAATPDEVHLTVSTVRYFRNGTTRSGVVSGHIADRLGEGELLPVYVHQNDNFKLPADPTTKVLMIGAGTGIAPYRAFMQERAALGAAGSAWLFFGERNFRTDFLYQTEWQAWLRDQTLARLTLAFSRDQTEKVYVQHRLREHARDIYAWLQDGAHVYVCGDAATLAPAVHETLLSILETETNSRERAVEYLHELHEQRRYQRDVY